MKHEEKKIVTKTPADNVRALGAAAAFNAVYAGYYLSISYCLFRGVTAAVAPNRQLYAGIFTILSSPN